MAATIPTAPFPTFSRLSGKECCYCSTEYNQRADARRHVRDACPCRQPFWYAARPKVPEKLYHPAPTAGEPL